MIPNRKACLALAAAVSAAAFTSACERGDAEEAPALQTAEVTRADLRITAEANGSIEPIRTIEVKSKAGGEILRLYADLGDVVDRGTLLVSIDPRDVENNWAQTLADLDVARARAARRS